MKFTILLALAVVALGQSIEPRIVVQTMPQFGSVQPLLFRLEGVSDPVANVFGASFVPDAGWFTTGCAGAILPDSTGHYQFVPHVYATKIFLAVLPQGTLRPCLSGNNGLPPSIENTPVRLLVHRGVPGSRTIGFSGRTWKVKGLPMPTGPGPNRFSAAPSHVWVDLEGRLHLRIAPCDLSVAWCSAEVVLNESLGYGEYKFVLDTPLANFHANTVLGMFTWSEHASWNHRELDIELSRWRGTVPTNAQFVVQPYYGYGNMLRFNAPVLAPSTTWKFDWAPQSVDFEGSAGPDLIQQWSHANASLIPPPADERVRINLYWANGTPGPTEQEVIIRSFTYTPSTRLQLASVPLDLIEVPSAGIPNQRLRIAQPVWAFQTPLPGPFQPFPLAGTQDADVWFTVHPNWQPRDRFFTARAGTGSMNVHQFGSTATTEQRMVGMMYYNFFSRLPGVEEVDFQVTQALHRGASAGELADNFFRSGEFNENGRFVAGLYTGLLCRDADYDGWRFQTRTLASGFTDQTTLVRNFLDSAEYKVRNGTPSDAEFVRLLYRCVLGREGGPGEIILQATETARIGRVAMARAFLRSDEFRVTTGPRITAFLLYATLLNREPSAAERDGWATLIRNGMTARTAIDGFVTSAEFPLAFR